MRTFDDKEEEILIHYGKDDSYVMLRFSPYDVIAYFFNKYNELEVVLRPFTNEKVKTESKHVEEEVDKLGKFKEWQIPFQKDNIKVFFSIKGYENIPVFITKFSFPEGAYVESFKEKLPSLKARVYMERLFGYTPFCWLTPVFGKIGIGLRKIKPIRERILSKVYPNMLGAFSLFFNEDLNRSLIISALKPTGSQIAYVDVKKKYFEYTIKLDNNIIQLPKGSEVSSIMVFGKKPVETFKKWGNYVKKIIGDKDEDYHVYNYYRDFFNSIQYWTDMGAAYWYRTLPGRRYYETLKAVINYFRKQGIPLKYLQIDSWWYPKGKDGGALEYVEDSSMGINLRKLCNDFKVKLIGVHLRWLSSESPYLKRYRAFVRNDITCIENLENFFKDLAISLKKKGVYMVRHDWLTVIRELCKEIYMCRPEGVERYLDAFLKSLKSYGLTAEICMPDFYHILPLVKHNNVLMIRSSEDYGQALPKQYLLYQNAYLSTLFNILGIAPFFDVFITSNWHAYADILSRTLMFSPIAIGDPIDEDPLWIRGISIELLRKFFDPNWKLLRPEKPSMLSDEMFMYDPAVDGVPLKIVNKHKEFTFIALFNVDLMGKDITYEFSSTDIGISKGAVIYRHWDETIHKNNIKGVIKPGDAHLLIAFKEKNAPVLLGLKEYAIPPLTILEEKVNKINENKLSIKLKLVDKGELIVYGNRRVKDVFINGKKQSFTEKNKILKIKVNTTNFVLQLHY